MMINWITLHVRDFEVSKRFYTGFLGLPLTQEFSPRPGMTIAFLGQQGETQLELILDTNHPLPPVVQGAVSIGITSSRYSELLTEARKTGLLIGEPAIMGGTMECFFVSDPDGTGVQVIKEA
jgi:lactoylglutathione lyase